MQDGRRESGPLRELRVGVQRVAVAAQAVEQGLLRGDRVVDSARRLDRMTMMMGYAGICSSLLEHAGGQEDQLIDIALELRGRGV